MKARNNNLSLSNILLCISIVIIILMGIYINNLSNELESLKQSNLNNEIITNSNSESNKKVETEKKFNDEIVGLWKTYQINDLETNNTITSLSKFFGTSYLSFGSTLKLNDDGTFLDSIYPITSSDISTEGTYKVTKDSNQSDELYIVLEYSDKTEKTFTLTYENKSPILTSSFENGKYEFYFKK